MPHNPTPTTALNLREDPPRGMAASEVTAWRWLLEYEGYTPETLRFQRRASPDFLGADGRGWEVKLVRNRCVAISRSQLGPLRAHGQCAVLIMRVGHAVPEAIMPIDASVTIPGHWRGYSLALVEYGRAGEVLNLREFPVPGATAIKAAARARGLTLPQYVYRLALLHAAVRELAIDEPRAQKILETLGLQTVTA